jgi:DNA-binding IclR family transcriptional regulator
VLLCIALDPEMKLHDVAERVGITERAVQRIVADLVDNGYLSRIRAGRRNRYHVHVQQPLRHPLEAHQPLSALLALVMDPRLWESRPVEPARRTITRKKRSTAASKTKPKD